MPWKSDKQRRWGNSPAGHAALGDAGVNEWNSASKGMKLPKHAAKPKYDGEFPQRVYDLAEGTTGPPEQDKPGTVSNEAQKHLRQLLGRKDDKHGAIIRQLLKTSPRDKANDAELKKEAGYDGVEYDGSTQSNDPNALPPLGGGATTNTNQGPPFSNFGQNLGGPMNPWDMTWGQKGNPYSAPMDPTAQQGMQNTTNFINSGMGFGGGQNYLNDVLGGKYLNLDSNPYLGQIVQGMKGEKADQDALANREIGSRMAAGGNALSGARLEQEGRYSNLSNANFNDQLGKLLSGQYQNERGLMNTAVGQETNMANTYLNGMNQQFNQGMVGTGMSQADIDRQYSDWQNAAKNQYNDYTNSGNLFKQIMSSGYPGSSQPNYSESMIGGLLAGLLGSGSQNGGLLNSLSKLLGGGGKGGGGPAGGAGGGPGGKSGGPGGGQPGRDSSGYAPGDQGYNPLTDPGSNYYIDPSQGGNSFIDPNTGQATYEDSNGTNWTLDPSTGSFVPDYGGQYNSDSWDNWLNGGQGSGEDPWAGTGGSNDYGNTGYESYGWD